MKKDATGTRRRCSRAPRERCGGHALRRHWLAPLTSGDYDDNGTIDVLALEPDFFGHKVVHVRRDGATGAELYRTIQSWGDSEPGCSFSSGVFAAAEADVDGDGHEDVVGSVMRARR